MLAALAVTFMLPLAAFSQVHAATSALYCYDGDGYTTEDCDL